MRLKFGVAPDGELASIDEVARGKTNLACLYCSGSLTAKKGSVKEHPRSYSERWLWESSDYPLCTSERACYTSPAPRFWYGWQHRRYFPRRSHGAGFARQGHHGIRKAFGF